MLIPKFSIRWLLALTVVFAFVFLVAKYAMSGEIWAISILVSVAAAATLATGFALMFLFVAGLVKLVPVRNKSKVESPFAADRLPPQVVPSREAEAR